MLGNAGETCSHEGTAEKKLIKTENCILHNDKKGVPQFVNRPTQQY